MTSLNERYVVDADGNRVAVLLDITQYQRLLHELASVRAGRDADSAIEAGERGRQPDRAPAAPGDRLADSGIRRHARSPNASVESLRRAMGVIALKEPVQPRSWRLFDDEDDEIGAVGDHARD